MTSIPVRWRMGNPDIFVHNGDTVTLVGPTPGSPFALVNHSSQLLCISPWRNWFRLFPFIFFYLFAGVIATVIITEFVGHGGQQSGGEVLLMSLPGLVALLFVLKTCVAIERESRQNARRRRYAREAAKLVSWTDTKHNGARGVVEGVMTYTRHTSQSPVDWEIFRMAIEGSEREKLVCAIRTLQVKGGLRAGDIVGIPRKMLFKGRVNVITSIERT